MVRLLQIVHLPSTFSDLILYWYENTYSSIVMNGLSKTKRKTQKRSTNSTELTTAHFLTFHTSYQSSSSSSGYSYGLNDFVLNPAASASASTETKNQAEFRSFGDSVIAGRATVFQPVTQERWGQFHFARTGVRARVIWRFSLTTHCLPAKIKRWTSGGIPCESWTIDLIVPTYASQILSVACSRVCFSFIRLRRFR